MLSSLQCYDAVIVANTLMVVAIGRNKVQLSYTEAIGLKAAS